MIEISFTCPNLPHEHEANLTDYADYDDFLEHVKRVSGFCDYCITDAPDALMRFVDAAKLCQEAWDNYVDLDESDRKVVEAWCTEDGSTPDWSSIQDSFLGVYETAEDYAREVFPISGIPESLLYYVDFDLYAKDLEVDRNIVHYGNQVYVFMP